MAVPGYLSSSYRVAISVGIVDCADIITALRTELVTNNSPAWTEPSSQKFKSPVDADGRFFYALMTRVDAARLQMDVIDQNNVTICQRRVTISGTYNKVTIFSGQYHLCVDVLKSDMTSEFLQGGILDFYPQAQALSSRYVYGGGSRTTADALGSNDWTQCAMLDNTTPTLTNRASTWNAFAYGEMLYTLSGNLLYHPRELWANTASLTKAYAGRCYQQVIVPYLLGDSGTLIKVPLSDTVVGQFRMAAGYGIVDSKKVLAYRVG